MTLLLFFLNLIFLNSLGIQMIFSIVMIYIIIKLLRSKLMVKDVSLFAYKITNFTYTFLILLLYIMLIILLLFFYRLLNIFREIDLKKIYIILLQYVYNTKFINIITDIVFFLTLIILILLILVILKKIFVKEFNKIHIYYCEDTICKYIEIFYSRLCLKYTLNRSIIYDFLQKYIQDSKTLYEFSHKFIDNLGVVFLVIFFLYDIFFNNFVITKIYLILPFVCIHIQYILYYRFMTERDISLDARLNTLYYEEILFQDNNNLYFNHGIIYSKDDLIELQKHILRNFKLEGLTQTDIINYVDDKKKK